MLMFESELQMPPGWTASVEEDGRGHARYRSPDGTIDLAYYELLPGVLLTNIDLACRTLPAFNPLGSSLATINWCVSGRCEVDFGERGSFVVSEDTLCVSSSLARRFSYPTHAYRGFEVFLDFEHIGDEGWALFGSLGLTEQALRAALLPDELGVNLRPSGQLLEAVRSLRDELELAEPRTPWLVLRLCQLLMALSEADLASIGSRATYLRRGQRDIAQLVYQHIVDHPAPVVGLSGLARTLGTSEASLRSYFERMYGQTPAAFARSCALAKGAELLRTSDLPVAEVSQACGYANPSKFSAAFRREYGANPLEYRRRSRLSEFAPAHETKGIV